MERQEHATRFINSLRLQASEDDDQESDISVGVISTSKSSTPTNTTVKPNVSPTILSSAFLATPFRPTGFAPHPTPSRFISKDSAFSIRIDGDSEPAHFRPISSQIANTWSPRQSTRLARLTRLPARLPDCNRRIISPFTEVPNKELNRRSSRWESQWLELQQ
ncbi:hypothetical protein Vi05172_g6721 [Venturia inaequalis]|nr:hypothetical protein Vi05172_g6721 [Venturia inaequalis]